MSGVQRSMTAAKEHTLLSAEFRLSELRRRFSIAACGMVSKPTGERD
jgi:hypothetical protein